MCTRYRWHHCNTSLSTPPATRPADGRRLPHAPQVIAASSLAIITDSACRVFAQRLPECVPSVCTPIWTWINVSTLHNCHDKDLTVNSGNSRVPEQEANLVEGYFGLAIVVMSWEDQDWSGALTEAPPHCLLLSHSTEPVMFIAVMFITALLIGNRIQGMVNWQIR